MKGSDVQTPLRQLLKELNWSCEQLINRVNESRVRRGSQPLHSKTAYPWAGRGMRPSPDVIGDVLAVLSVHTARSVTASDMEWDRRSDRRKIRMNALDTPYNATALELVRETQGDPMQRRTFFLLSGAALTAPALELMMNGAPALAAAQNGDRVSDQLVQSVERAVQQTRELDDSEGSTPVLLWAGGLWQNLGKLLTESQYNDKEGVRLQTAYIEMAETYGWMLFDAGKHPQSQRVFQTGIRVAHESTEAVSVHQATANLLASAAYQASWLGQHSEATTMLDVALNRKPYALSPRVRAVVADRQIVLAGHQGDAESLRRADDRARAELQLSEAGSGDTPWWSSWLTSSAVDAQTGQAWLAAGQPDLAEPYLTRSTTRGGSDCARDRMLRATELADARLQTSDVEGACAAARQAHQLSHEVSSHRVQEHLDRVTSALQHHNAAPAVRSFFDELRES